jgi:hypothetical protein
MVDRAAMKRQQQQQQQQQRKKHFSHTYIPLLCGNVFATVRQSQLRKIIGSQALHVILNARCQWPCTAA